jgi:hypothetical protein
MLPRAARRARTRQERRVAQRRHGRAGDYRTQLHAKAAAVAAALTCGRHSFAFLHVKAVDDTGHDRDTVLKARGPGRGGVALMPAPLLQPALPTCLLPGNRGTPPVSLQARG